MNGGARVTLRSAIKWMAVLASVLVVVVVVLFARGGGVLVVVPVVVVGMVNRGRLCWRLFCWL